MKNIQWFPGHMAKAMRILKEQLKTVDIVCELLDARIPLSSSNPELDKLIQMKERIIILNKRDLAKHQITEQWIGHFNQQAATFAINAASGDGLFDVLEEVKKKAKVINQRLKSRGRQPRNIRMLIVGIPNVGKSALINRLANRASAKVENRPGVTRGKQWIKVRDGLLLLDSPGILWPKFASQEVGLKLAMTGAIRSEVLDEIEIAYHLLKWMIENAHQDLSAFFGVQLLTDPYEMLLAIGRKRGLIQSGGRVREEQTARMILKEFRDGRLGKFSLESPPEDKINHIKDECCEADC